MSDDDVEFDKDAFDLSDAGLWLFQESAMTTAWALDEVKRYKAIYGADWKPHFDVCDLDEEDR